jgi:ADP-ribosyl-[dinitrogen reductase] hydrolase
MKINNELESRFIGAIMGCACGDAAGAPYEGATAAALKGVPRLFDPIPQIPAYPRGQYTDDTQLTLVLAETYIQCKGFDGKDFANRLAGLWKRREIVGAGASCTDAAYNILSGIPWQEAGTEEGRAGDGSAMRASPAGLWNYQDLEQLKLDSCQQSIVTHKDPRAQAGAAAVAWAVARNLSRADIDPETYSKELAEFIKDIHQEFAEYILKLPRWLEMDEEESKIEIACAGWIQPKRRIDFITPFVIPAVLIALFYFMKYPKDFSASLEAVIRAGGDVDTTGAIMGAISGAYNGLEAIPEHLIRDLHQADMIKDTAHRLFTAKNRDASHF